MLEFDGNIVISDRKVDHKLITKPTLDFPDTARDLIQIPVLGTIGSLTEIVKRTIPRTSYLGASTLSIRHRKPKSPGGPAKSRTRCRCVRTRFIQRSLNTIQSSLPR
jgi:hypothetical protein